MRLHIVILISFALLFFACNEDQGKLTHPKIKHKGISRIVTLLNSSSVEKPNAVHIFFYGQSIVGGMQPPVVIKSLREKYPTAIITFSNKPIGGFRVPSLIKTAEHDLYHENPDLIIFHAYGGIEDQLFEKLIRSIRSKMSSDILLFDHHYAWDHRKENLEEKNRNDSLESVAIKEIAIKYDCAFVNVRQQWSQYLQENDLKGNELIGNTKDPNVHPNEKGNKLLRRIIISTLTNQNFNDYELDSDILRKEINIDSIVKTVKLNFNGNRLELILDSIPPSPPKIEILIDQKRPSEFKSSFYITRPGKAFKSWMPALKLIDFGSTLPVEEDWLIEICNIDRKNKTFTFEIKGDKTGFDGIGSSEEDFISDSDRIRINKEDFNIFYTENLLNVETPENFQIPFQVKALVEDTLKVNTSSSRYTVFVGPKSGEHQLELNVLQGKIKNGKLMVFKPYLNEE